MLILKSFFRKKSTQIYLIIYSIIIATIIFSLYVITYSKNLMNEMYKKASFLIMTSTKDYYDEISKIENVEGIERIILFEANDDDTIFKHQSYTLYSMNGPTIEYDNGEKANEIVTWEDYMGTPNKDAIIITSDKYKDFKLEDTEIALSSEGVKDKTKETIDSLIGKNISFIYNNNKVEFSIKKYYYSKKEEMTISEDKFNELILEDNKYSYKVYINNYLSLDSIKKKIKNLDDDIVIKTKYDFEDSEDFIKYNRALSLRDIFYWGGFITVFIFIIILTIITENIKADEKKNKEVQRMLGYNKKQLKKYTRLKLISLFTCALIISLIIFSITIIILF